MLPTHKQTLTGWGRYPAARATVHHAASAEEVQALVERPGAGGIVSRGCGRSYGDAALNAGGAVLSHRELRSVLRFDAGSGLVECEAGISLAELIAHVLPHGWFPPVTPGTAHVTLGGAIAADVHGKNHHRDGSLARWITELHLATPALGTVRCSPDARPALFHATLGGMGLTGAIVRATMQLRRVESLAIRSDTTRAADLDGLLSALHEADARHRYSVAWIDGLARGTSLGRGVVIAGDHATAGESAGRRWASLAAGAAIGRHRVSVPFDAPSFALARPMVRAFNSVYWRAHPTSRDRLVPLAPFFYPLDVVGRWNLLYGRQGFAQYQCVLPGDDAAPLERVLDRVTRSGRASFLAVLKRFGAPSPGPLSFPTAGYTLSLDFPVRAGLAELARELDRLVIDAGGRVYLAKDALLDAETFRLMYPRAAELLAIRAEVDPEGRLHSSLAQRVGLVRHAGRGLPAPR
ncbi:MAG: linked oxidase domain protein [Gemmatimonadetes bacterium]|nr:linked oxidase domain protein [Gemmatimonadota bacterium]